MPRGWQEWWIAVAIVGIVVTMTMGVWKHC
jgi:hypothetical protein